MRQQLIRVGLGVILPALLLAAPVRASDEPSVGRAPATFHALRQLPAAERAALAPMSDAQLAAVTGAVGPIELNIGLNIAVLNQISVCAVCMGVQQTTVGSSSQSIRF